MSERENNLFLFDILIAVEKIKDIVKDYKNANELLYSYRDWDSLIREFEIIGEAMKKCIEFGIFENDKDKRKVVDFRNILIHKNLVIDKISQIDISKRNELIEDLIKENNYLPFVVKKLQDLQNESK